MHTCSEDFILVKRSKAIINMNSGLKNQYDSEEELIYVAWVVCAMVGGIYICNGYSIILW